MTIITKKMSSATRRWLSPAWRRGFGPLRANEPIILDVFPRSQKTGYFGDITRTVVRGRATEAIRKLYHTIERAQEIGFEQIKHGASAREVHLKIREFFVHDGYKTGKVKGRMQGFFHGTGHGVGLEIHEAPGLGPNSNDTLQANHVVTMEPGLYYWDLGGGVRLEDMALITTKGTRNLWKSAGQHTILVGPRRDEPDAEDARAP